MKRLLSLLLFACHAFGQSPPAIVSLDYLPDYDYTMPVPFVDVVWITDGVSPYLVYRSTVSGGPYQLIYTGPGSNECGLFVVSLDCNTPPLGCYTDTTVSFGVTYYYVIQLEATSSPELSAALPAVTVPLIPPILTKGPEQ
jgi:hypothetical protein